MTTYEEWQQQKEQEKAQEEKRKAQREQDNFVSAWIERERQQQENESGLLCSRCHHGVPGHKAAYFCPQCMLELQITILYSYSGINSVMYKSVKSNKMNDV